MFPRPRGRGRIGCVWNQATGAWDVDPNHSPAAPSQPRVPKDQRFTVVVAPSLPPRATTTGFTSQELAANTRRNEEEARAIDERCRRAEADALIRQRRKAEAETLEGQRRAEAAARDRYEQVVFLQPYRTASALFASHQAARQRRAHVYWLDAHGDMYECPEQPYEVAAVANRLATKRRLPPTFELRIREVERRVTHVDDPETLAPGEWEYRRIREEYRVRV